jgi:hypothetical protein
MGTYFYHLAGQISMAKTDLLTRVGPSVHLFKRFIALVESFSLCRKLVSL